MHDRTFRTWQTAVIGAVGFIGFLLIWELIVRVGIVDDFFLPPPSAVLQRAVQMATGEDPVLLGDIGISSVRVLTGFFFSVLVGVPLGLMLGMSSFFRALAAPVISLIRPLPALSWIPLSMLWLGIGEEQKYAIVFMGCVASVLVYTTDATLRVDSSLRLAALNLGASRSQVMRYVILPGALPNILSGLKVVLAIAWTCVISAEMVGANRGLGFRIWTAKEWSDTGQVLVGMISISLTVLFLDVLFRLIEKLLLPWQRTGK